MQFQWGFEQNFYTASFSLTNPNPFISDDWHQPPVAPLGLDSSCMLFIAANFSTLLPFPLFPSLPFKFFIDLKPPPLWGYQTAFPWAPLVAPEKWAWKKSGSRQKTWRGCTWALYGDWKALSCYTSCPSWKNVREWDHFLCILRTRNRPGSVVFELLWGCSANPALCRIVIGSPVPLKCACSWCRKQ